MLILSEKHEDYAELERYLENNVLNFAGNNAFKEDALLKRFNDDSSLVELVELIKIKNDKILSELKGNISSISSLPTKYDDRLSYSIASSLIKKVIEVGKVFPFEHDNYGGFCCVPTGRVSAIAAPIKTGKKSKVFIIFESGIFQFISGNLSLFVNVMPKRLLEGSCKKDWYKVWQEYYESPEHKDVLTEACNDFRNWRLFFQHYNTQEVLASASITSFGSNGLRIYSDMLRGCEIFIAAHEYSHAILKHQNSNLDPSLVEKEADKWGVRFTNLICSSEGMNINFVMCGVALFFSAIGDSLPAYYLPSKKRIIFLIDSLSLQDDREAKIMKDLVEVVQTIYDEIINFNPT